MEIRICERCYRPIQEGEKAMWKPEKLGAGPAMWNHATDWCNSATPADQLWRYKDVS